MPAASRRPHRTLTPTLSRSAGEGVHWPRRTALLGLFALAGCGFQPLYGARERGGSGAAEQLAAIAVSPIQNRVGQILRNALIDQLSPYGPPDQPRYRLAITLAVGKEGLAIAKNETITRFNLHLNATFVLYDAESGGEVTRGRVQSLAAYNVVDSEYATLAGQKDAEGRAARDLGETITTRLAVFFTRQPA